MKYAGYPTPCETFTYGEVEDYTANVYTIGGNEPPVADFTFTTNDLTVYFTDASTDPDGTIVGWDWDFGDGNTSTQQDPTHTYAAGGTYTVSLTVTDNDGATDSVSKPVTVTEPNAPPVADFTFTTSDLTANFTDASTDSDGTIVSWLWNFGDGNTSTVQNPSQTYAAGGTYTVTLTVTDDDGATDSVSKPVTVTEPPNIPPTASFTYTINGLTVNFTDTSTDPDGTIVSWLWNFGDGNTSTLQNPTHTYATGGTYTVTLTVTDNDGATDTASALIALGVEMYVADITQSIRKTGVNYQSTAVVTILDTGSAPVANATVTITWSGVVSGSASGVTAADGTVSFISAKLKSTGPFTITVNNVTHATLTYNPALNIETSDSATY
jgi:PKD repeat protein